MAGRKRYEMMCLLDPLYAEEETEEKQQRVQGILESQGAEIEEMEEYGKRKLAYEIGDHDQGYYLLFNFKGTPDTLDGIADRSNVEEGLLRYEIVKKEDGSD